MQSILEICSQVNNISEYFLKTRKILHIQEKYKGRSFLSPLQENWLELRTSQNKDNFLITRKSFLTK